MRGKGGWAAGVIDDVADLAFVIECNCDHVVETHIGVDGDLDGASKNNLRMAEDAVDAEAPSFVAGHGAGYFVGGPAVGAGGAGEAGLIGRIVGNFGLVEVSTAGVAAP